jgi:hypothetical protein
MNLRVRLCLLYVAFRYGLLYLPTAEAEQGACCSRHLLVGVDNFGGIAVMAESNCSGRRFGNWFHVDSRQDGVGQSSHTVRAVGMIPARA